MTKTGTAADKHTVKALPALRASLRWFKRETVRRMTENAKRTGNPKLASWYWAKTRTLRAAAPTAFRADYTAARVREITTAPLAELAAVTRGSLVRLSA